MTAHDIPTTLEDLTFLADHGVGLEEAAHRTGFPSRDALDRWLRRHNGTHLLRRLSSQERRAA